MMKLKKCPNCKAYNLKEKCKNCDKETKDAHYKYIKIRDAPKSQNNSKNNDKNRRTTHQKH